MDCSPPGSSAHEILQVRILEWVAMPPNWDFPDPKISWVLRDVRSLTSPALVGGFFTVSATWEAPSIKVTNVNVSAH